MQTDSSLKIFLHESYTHTCTCISNHGSDYYVGMAPVQNGVLYIRYRITRPKTFTEPYQTHTDERSSLFKCKTTLEVSLTFVGVEKFNRKNIDFVLFIFFFFFFARSSCKSTKRTQSHYIPK